MQKAPVDWRAQLEAALKDKGQLERYKLMIAMDKMDELATHGPQETDHYGFRVITEQDALETTH